MSLALSKLALQIGDSPTLKINAQARALKAAGKAVIHLGGGEPAYPAPQAAVEAIIDADTLWNALLLFQGYTFYTMTGLQFSYEIRKKFSS